MIVLAAACAALVAVAVLLAHYARRHVTKNVRVAWVFATPGIVLATAAAYFAPTGSAPAPVGLAAAAAMFFLAAWAFVPTRRTRFAEFERRFWAHVARSQHHRSHG
jgi:hypothetical protein